MVLADLPVTFWAFWMAAGFVLFAGVLWAIARLAVDEDAGEAAAGDGPPP